MAVTTDDRFSWRDIHHVETGTGAYWELGPLQLWARRESHEWSVSFVRGDHPLSDAGAVQVPTLGEAPEDGTSLRFGFREPPAEIRLMPALAKRPVVVTPEEPFSLPPREETTLYVSTPIWVGLEVGEPPVQLLEEASHRPSDTWFGDSTRDGELCYAIRTPATLLLDGLQMCVHRAFSVVHIQNRASSVLEIEKVKLPAPNMSLFLSREGSLWTEELSLIREQEGEVASVVLGTDPATMAGDAERIAEPRKMLEKGLLDRTFGGLIRELRG